MAASRTASRFAEFVQALHEPGTALLSPTKVGAALQLDAQGIAKRARVHPETVAGTPDSEAVQAYLRRVLRVLSAASQVNDCDLDRTIAWFKHHPIAELRRRTPDELVSEGRTDAVIAYIDSISGGHIG